MPKQGRNVLREQTEQFIEQNPIDLVLVRHAKVPDGAGGTRSVDTTLEPQRVRIVGQRTAVSVERRTVSGVVVSPEQVVVGEWDLDIQRGDTFRHQGVLMEVVWVHDLGYEKMAEVTFR